jgi:hypothetical protein
MRILTQILGGLIGALVALAGVAMVSHGLRGLLP